MTDNLRDQAEARAKATEVAETGVQPPEETRRALHELRVHQIELEMQNEELRRAQTELDAARARYFDLYDLAPVGYCTVSEQGLILEANLTAATLLGVPRGELVKQPWTRFIHKGDQDRYYQHRKQLFATGEAQDSVLQMVKREGATFWVNLTASLAQDAVGTPVSRIVISDITGHKQGEQALRESEERYRSLVVSAPLGVILQAADGTILTWNRMSSEIFGLTEAEAVGKNARKLHWDTFRADGTPWLTHDYPSATTLESGTPCREACMRLVTPDGSNRWLSINTEPLFQEGGEKPSAVIITVADITERWRDEQFRENVERIIRHDIRSPLISLFTMAQLAMKGEVKEVLSEMFPKIEQGVRQVVHLLDAAEPLRKMEKGAYAPNKEPVNLLELLCNVRESLASLTRQSKVGIVVSAAANIPAGEVPQFCGEAFLIEDMLMNLVKNAVEASPAGKDVTIDCHVEQAVQHIDIHNFGVVPEILRDQFFEKDASSGKIYGTGLGTYSAQLIAKAHGGHIEFTTSGIEGTTVTILLPCGANE